MVKDKSAMVRRVIARHTESMEHASPEAMERYLKQHPNADPRNHSVSKDHRDKGVSGDYNYANDTLEKLRKNPDPAFQKFIEYDLNMLTKKLQKAEAHVDAGGGPSAARHMKQVADEIKKFVDSAQDDFEYDKEWKSKIRK